MTRVIFYTNVSNRHNFLLRFLLSKVYRAKKTALVYCEAEQLTKIDDDLWLNDFLPHAPMAASNADSTPILLTDERAPPSDEFFADFLVSLHPQLPAFVGRFPTYVDIVGQTDADKKQGRTRFQHFKENGYPIEHISINK